MKPQIFATLAMFWLAGPALAAIPQTSSTATTPADIPGQGRIAGQHLDQTTVGDAQHPTVHVYRRGEHLTSAYGSFDVVNDWSRYALPAPPDHYHWVRFGANFLLVQSDTGVIADIVATG